MVGPVCRLGLCSRTACGLCSAGSDRMKLGQGKVANHIAHLARLDVLALEEVECFGGVPCAEGALIVGEFNDCDWRGARPRLAAPCAPTVTEVGPVGPDPRLSAVVTAVSVTAKLSSRLLMRASSRSVAALEQAAARARNATMGTTTRGREPVRGMGTPMRKRRVAGTAIATVTLPVVRCQPSDSGQWR